jgi:hypothetical protein
MNVAPNDTRDDGISTPIRTRLLNLVGSILENRCPTHVKTDFARASPRRKAFVPGPRNA